MGKGTSGWISRNIQQLTCLQCGLHWERSSRPGGRPKYCSDCNASYKWCGSCRKTLERSSFHADQGAKDGAASACIACKRRHHLAARARNPHLNRERRLRREYGMTLQDYDRMSEAQGGVCALCKTKPDKLMVDHCHKSGKARSLLCTLCNTGIGHLREDPDLMRAAALYVERHRTPETCDTAP